MEREEIEYIAALIDITINKRKGRYEGRYFFTFLQLFFIF